MQEDIHSQFLEGDIGGVGTLWKKVETNSSTLLVKAMGLREK